jgi:hypothetical protein
MFALNLLQSLVDLFTSNIELINSYIMDDYHEISESVLDNSKNIIYFKAFLISEEDFEQINHNLKYSAIKKMYMLSLFLNPEIVKKINTIYPNLVFYTIFHSNLINERNRDKLLADEKEVDYSYNRGFMGSEYLCKLFRKLIFNFFDDN